MYFSASTSIWVRAISPRGSWNTPASLTVPSWTSRASAGLPATTMPGSKSGCAGVKLTPRTPSDRVTTPFSSTVRTTWARSVPSGRTITSCSRTVPMMVSLPPSLRSSTRCADVRPEMSILSSPPVPFTVIVLKLSAVGLKSPNTSTLLVPPPVLICISSMLLSCPITCSPFPISRVTTISVPAATASPVQAFTA